MDALTEQRLIGRVLELAAAGTQDLASRGTALPVATYTDAVRFAAERRTVFRRYPLMVARSAQLPAPGSFLTLQLPDLPLLLARAEDGKVHALINVCRHRGTRVCFDAAGTRTRFVCPYHAWTYGLDGALLKIPDDAGFVGLSREDRGLVRLPAVERHGFVWVLPDPAHGPPDLARFLGDLDGDFARLSLDTHVMLHPRTLTVATNWKLAIDIFLEAYHVRTAHARTIAPLFFDNLGVFERIRPHQRNLFPKRTIESLRGADAPSKKLRPHCNLLYQIFPNSLLLVQPDHVSAFHAQPDGIDRTIVAAYTLVPEAPATDKAHAHWQKNIDILFGAVAEDIALGESIQRGFASGANETLLFGRYEQSLAWFHDSVQAALDG